MKHNPLPPPTHTSPHYLSQYLIFLFLLLTVLLIPGASFSTLLSMYINDRSLWALMPLVHITSQGRTTTLSGVHVWV